MLSFHILEISPALLVHLWARQAVGIDLHEIVGPEMVQVGALHHSTIQQKGVFPGFLTLASWGGW